MLSFDVITQVRDDSAADLTALGFTMTRHGEAYAVLHDLRGPYGLTVSQTTAYGDSKGGQ